MHMNRIRRLWRHLWLDLADTRRAVPDTMAERLAQCEQCRLLSIEDLPISAVSKGMDERVRTLHRRFGNQWSHTLAINDVYFDHINVPLNALGRKDLRNISAGDGSAKAAARCSSRAIRRASTCIRTRR